MKGTSQPVPISVYPEYVYVLLVFVAAMLFNIWQAVNVSKMRKKHKVDYPTMYSDKNEFNCYQRAHQNTLENLPFFLFPLPIAGIRHPLLTTAFGLFWIFARTVYSFSYYTGDPSKRVPGALMTYAAQWLLVGCMISTGAQFAGWW